MTRELDEVTLARARRGDSTALSALVRHYQRPVYALIGRLSMGRRETLDDLAQESFIRVCRGLPRFEPGERARLSTWILTIVTRTCLNALRDGRRVMKVQAVDDGEEVAPGDPEQTASEREQRRRVEAAMVALPEDMRAVLVLRAYHDFDYDEIAAAPLPRGGDRQVAARAGARGAPRGPGRRGDAA
jgi:RNA polymerase sigma-70 factor (ECF subfamily)